MNYANGQNALEPDQLQAAFIFQSIKETTVQSEPQVTLKD
jgi:hypothetical protein